MRVLLDEQLPRQLGRLFTGHSVSTVQRQGWAGATNGELLRRAAANDFEVFVTGDRNIQFQQNLAGLPLRVIVLASPSNTLEDLAPLVPLVLQTLAAVRPGEVRRIGLV